MKKSVWVTIFALLKLCTNSYVLGSGHYRRSRQRNVVNSWYFNWVGSYRRENHNLIILSECELQGLLKLQSRSVVSERIACRLTYKSSYSQLLVSCTGRKVGRLRTRTTSKLGCSGGQMPLIAGWSWSLIWCWKPSNISPNFDGMEPLKAKQCCWATYTCFPADLSKRWLGWRLPRDSCLNKGYLFEIAVNYYFSLVSIPNWFTI